MFDTVGTATIDRLLDVFRYAARRYGIKHFVIDSLMTTDVPGGRSGAMTAQKAAMRKIVAFCHETNSHVHLVAHPAKARPRTKRPASWTWQEAATSPTAPTTSCRLVCP